MQRITGNRASKWFSGWESPWARIREGFNPPVGPMQPVAEGKHAMVAIDDPIFGSNKPIDEGD